MSGFPNAGKSTLLNCILKEKISIVSHKVQTTKDKISGVMNVDNTQLVFTDTPGITKNTKFFDKKISRSLLDMDEIVDFNLFIFDITNSIKKETLGQIINIVKSFKNNYLVLNKVDLVRKDRLLNSSKIINSEIKFLKTFMISAKKNKGIKYLVKTLIENAPTRPWKYSKTITTDKSMSFRISEITLVRGAGKGVIAIKLESGDRVDGFILSEHEKSGLTVETERGREITIRPKKYGASRASKGTKLLKRGSLIAWEPTLLRLDKMFAHTKEQSDSPSEDFSSASESSTTLLVHRTPEESTEESSSDDSSSNQLKLF